MACSIVGTDRLARRRSTSSHSSFGRIDCPPPGSEPRQHASARTARRGSSSWRETSPTPFAAPCGRRRRAESGDIWVPSRHQSESAGARQMVPLVGTGTEAGYRRSRRGEMAAARFRNFGVYDISEAVPERSGNIKCPSEETAASGAYSRTVRLRELLRHWSRWNGGFRRPK
jgi:hypothetical protein